MNNYAGCARCPGYGLRENSKDRFERVEGKFVERFLEGIPLALGYVDVAYSDEKDTVFPSINKLQDFRITDRGACALNKAMFEGFTHALLDKGHAMDTNKQARTVSYSQKDEIIIKDVLDSLKKKFPAVIKNA